MSELLELYRKLGNERYAQAIAELAPYFGTIHPRFEDLRPGYCAIEIPNTREVQNHLGTLHAIAMCNGAELVAGLTTDVSIPDGRRWIPVEMNVRYLAKAESDVTIICDGEGIDWSTLGNIKVPVRVIDMADRAVCDVVITMNVGQRQG